ncbi:hypothetical protein HDU76_004954, partial [Blyttiomyces sp. JEL0837]
MFSGLNMQVLLGRTGIAEEEVDVLKQTDSSAMIMPDSNSNTRYYCVFDTSDQFEDEVYSNNMAALDARDSTDAIRKRVRRAVKQMSHLSGKCLNYTSTWWKYEYCHMKSVRQYSDFPPSIKSKPLKYTLGLWRSKVPDHAFYGNRLVAGEGGAELVEYDADGNMYLRMFYGDGELCEGKPRVVEVQ